MDKLIFNIKRVNWIRGVVITVIILIASVAYATVIKEMIKDQGNLTLPLIFNGVIPLAGLGIVTYFGKKFVERYLDYIKETFKELIEAKNSHTERIIKVETKIEDCPNCRKVSYPD